MTEYTKQVVINMGDYTLEGRVKPGTDFDTRFILIDDKLGRVWINGWLIDSIEED